MVRHKETESESEGTSHAEEPRFRISVCMKRFYSDERARAYVSVSARRRVRWLHRRLRRLFALPPAFRLLCRGHLLPRDEPLALLDRDDPVEVVPVHAEIDQAATAKDVVHTVEMVPTAELECSDDLTETKRQALLMLEQYYAADAQSPVDSGACPPADSGACPSADSGAHLPADSGAYLPADSGAHLPADSGAHLPADSGAHLPADSGAHLPADSSTQSLADSEAQLRPRRRRVRRRRRVSAFCVPEPAAVLRNELQPRAPRVVRPLPADIFT